MTKKIIAFALLSFIAGCANAQFADSIKMQLLKDWNRSKEYTLSYLNTMPANAYSFKPQDSVRTFAQQMIHMAQGTVSLMAAGTDVKIPGIINRQNLENIPSALNADSVKYFITLSYDYAISSLTTFNMANSFEYVRRGNFNESRLAWMLKGYEHQAHHRGQTTIYLRTAGLIPPNEKLFDN
ncbi:MAG: damage-inducible protein DinB [Rhizobacter sp.]|nr:damage-inducible protein DinB [Ferruginibacter sp.]